MYMSILNDWLEERYNSAVRAYNERLAKYDSTVYYVTDLLKCGELRRCYTAHEIGRLSIKPPIVIGDLVHIGLQKIFERDGWVSEVSASKTIDNYTIRARCDLIRDNEIIEIKYTSYLQNNIWASRRHNIDQCKIYNNLFDTDVVHLVFFSPGGMRQIDINERYSDAEILEMIENPKYPRYSWECKYCKFADKCEYRR
ncbi:MAG: hypothetical protein DRJ47_06035 [Thermoprotei archaeon]|nr:MAG: hypothetical protein DRJ47_06035 [Thermoprotei archaeon]